MFNIKKRKAKKISWKIVINQQLSSLDPEKVASEAETKDSKRVEGACKGQENCIKVLKERL